jgi:hypothetical protein
MAFLVKDEDRVGRAHLGHALQLVEEDITQRRDVGHADQQHNIEFTACHRNVLDARRGETDIDSRGYLADIRLAFSLKH